MHVEHVPAVEKLNTPFVLHYTLRISHSSSCLSLVSGALNGYQRAATLEVFGSSTSICLDEESLELLFGKNRFGFN